MRPQESPLWMLGSSLQGGLAQARLLAGSSRPVVITGEAGVGKSLLAAAVHEAGPSASRPMLSINIATSADRQQRLCLLGADFSNLTSSKRSLLEHPTTVLIKHIDLAYGSLQERLADCLASGLIRRPGSIRSKPVRCRVIFTFRKGVKELQTAGALEASLAKLLVGAPALHIRPLRERRTDLLELSRAFYGRELPEPFEQAVTEHSWPGNLAELRAALECMKPAPPSGALPERCRREIHQMLLRIEEGSEFSLRRSLEVIERGMIVHALKKTDGHRARAAQLLGLTDSALRWHIGRSRKLP